MSKPLFVLLSSILGAYLFAFAIGSFKEKELRALTLSAVFFVSFLAITTVISYASIGWLLWWAILLYVLGWFLLFLPLNKPNPVLHSPQARYDERDIMFARARYVPTTAAYEDYYSRFPEKKEADDEIRSLPELLFPGGKYYHPLKAAVADSYFNLNEKFSGMVEGAVASGMVRVDPEQLSFELKKMARDLGAVDAGIAALDPNIIYSHVGRGPGGYGSEIKLDHPAIFVFAVEMDYAAMQKAPQADVIVESSKQYLEAAKISIVIAEFLRSLGYESRAHMDANYRVILPPAAVAAGLGEMGRLGIFMSRYLGPRVRLGGVTTTAPLEYDSPQFFGGHSFCLECKKCAKNCPGGAISFGPPKKLNGVLKWSTNQQACYRYWREVGTDCGVCVRVCPFSKPRSITHNIVRAAIKMSLVARKAAIIADDLFYGRKPAKLDEM